MKLAIPKERRPSETRVAASPETARKLAKLGLDVWVEGGAGEPSHFADAAYAAAGATVATSAARTCEDAAVVLRVRAPSAAELDDLPTGAVLIGMLDPYREREALDGYARGGLTAFSMELLPRITRAQSMDVLSSQSNLAGYKAVIDAAAEFNRALPMMMTAAGTVPPARVLVLGTGVAGLQAIATARRLGAIVAASDVRPAAKEQVESLGAKFLTVPSEESAGAETAGGYAREMGEGYQRRQAALVAEALKRQDIVILTALIPGRPAPTLVTEAMIRSMRPGSVIVDLAVEQGGNCELSRPGETVSVGGVRVIGHRNVPGRLADDASALYARNLLNFVTPLLDGGTLAIDYDDEIVSATLLTRDGRIVHPAFRDGPIRDGPVRDGTDG